ncbi:MAG: RNA polymerase sigma factor [Flavobacteriales bacterium]|nr:RNA polymerase sigma factor [Flavobacteriales bacterium]
MSTLEFNEMLISSRPVMKSFALSFTKNSDDADDLLQDTMLKALKYRENFADGTNFRGWLYTIMRNIFLNRCKREQSGHKIFSRSTKDVSADWRSISADNISQEINEKDIWKQINQLKDDIRKPFIMAFEGYLYEEIADQMSIPTGTVKSRIFNARRQLMAAC